MFMGDCGQTRERLLRSVCNDPKRVGLTIGDTGQGPVLAGRFGGLADGFDLLGGEVALGPGRRRHGVSVGLEDGVEREPFVGDVWHQYTSSSSSPPAPTRTISPLLARSLAACTMAICACSTSRRRTGPMVSMSSRMILAARSLMLEKNMSRRLSEAPFSASAS